MPASFDDESSVRGGLQRPPEAAFRPAGDHFERLFDGQRLANRFAQFAQIAGDKPRHLGTMSLRARRRNLAVGAKPSLKPRQVGERQPAGAHVQAAELGAAVQLRKDLAGV